MARAKFDHRADILGLYKRGAPELDLNDQEFRFTALRPGLGPLPLDSVIEQVEWVDESSGGMLNVLPVLRGSATIRKPHPDQQGAKLVLKDGHRIRCSLRLGGSWTPLWEMRIIRPVTDVATGSMTVELCDDLWLVAQSQGDFRFVKGTRKRRNGWRYDEIVAEVCREYGVPIVALAHGQRRINHFEEDDCSPLYAIRRVVEKERSWTGIPLVIAWRWDEKRKRFGLHIAPFRRNPVLYMLSDQIQSAQVSVTRSAELVSQVEATGHVGAKGKAKKVTILVKSKEAQQQYGLLRREHNFTGRFDSRADLRRQAKQRLADKAEPVRALEVTHAGIAVVRRGDAIRVRIPEEGFKGERGVTFVQTARHQLSAGSYTMDLTLNFTDPLDPAVVRKEKATAARARKRSQRGGG
jgi:hypothetical protein